jgi:iron complex transport system substrate-binding protein
MKRIIALCLMMLLLAGCSGKKDQEYVPENPRLTFTDSTGYFVKAPESPQRVEVLEGTLARLWEMAGGTVVSGEFSSKPDFLIGSAQAPEQVETCKSARKDGVPAALFALDSFQEYLRILDIFTMITGDEDAYVLHGIQQREAVEEITRSIMQDQEIKVQVLRDGMVQTDGFVGAMLRDLGAQIVEENPDMVFLIGNQEQDGVVLDEELFRNPPLDRWADAYGILAEELYG